MGICLICQCTRNLLGSLLLLTDPFFVYELFLMRPDKALVRCITDERMKFFLRSSLKCKGERCESTGNLVVAVLGRFTQSFRSQPVKRVRYNQTGILPEYQTRIADWCYNCAVYSSTVKVPALYHGYFSGILQA